MSLPLVDLHWPGLPRAVGALSTTRSGGVSTAPYDDGTGSGGLNLGSHVGDEPVAVARNRALLRSLLPAEPAWLAQMHGTRVVDAALACQAGQAVEADASICTEAGVVCAILTADCLPVLLADADGRVVGAAHAGWRGLAGGILEITVAAMRAAGGDHLRAWLGPAIGPQQFVVGPEVRQAFDHLGPEAGAAFRRIPEPEGKYLADLYALARIALARVGVNAVSGGAHCTASDSRRFYSYRRDRITGRMASLIWIN